MKAEFCKEISLKKSKTEIQLHGKLRKSNKKIRGQPCKLNEVQEGITGSEEKVDEVDSSVKANVKIKPSRHQKIWDNLKRKKIQQ